MYDVSIEMKLYDNSFDSNVSSVKDSEKEDNKSTPIQAYTLESTFEARSTLSTKDVTHSTSKDSIKTVEEEALPPNTAVVPPSASNDPEKALNQK